MLRMKGRIPGDSGVNDFAGGIRSFGLRLDFKSWRLLMCAEFSAVADCRGSRLDSRAAELVARNLSYILMMPVSRRSPSAVPARCETSQNTPKADIQRFTEAHATSKTVLTPAPAAASEWWPELSGLRTCGYSGLETPLDFGTTKRPPDGTRLAHGTARVGCPLPWSSSDGRAAGCIPARRRFDSCLQARTNPSAWLWPLRGPVARGKPHHA